MVETSDVVGRLGESFGFGEWNLGIGQIGNFIMWFVLALFFVGIIGVVLVFIITKKTYRHKVTVIGLLGNNSMKKWEDRAKEVMIGRAGDKLFYLKKKKRFLPPPTIQVGKNEWLYWEREDGELINIGYQDLDKKQRELGFKFVDTDMRMQRLGIEKNLMYRLQKQNFWEKYGQTIVNVVFYVLITMLLIVLFVQWRKAGETLNEAVATAGRVLETISRMQETSPYVPESEKGEGSGVIPALVLLILTRRGGRRKWELAPL